MDLRQDRYSLRTSPQWLGPSVLTMSQVAEQVEIEMNSCTDNPLVDIQDKRILHGGNFQANSMGVVMDNIKVAINHMGRLMFA